MSIETITGPVYVVGPMSGRPRLNWGSFKRVWGLFFYRGRVLPTMPHQLECGAYSVDEWLDAIDASSLRLDEIDANGFAGSVRHILDVRPTLVAIEGWRESEGTRAEVAVAQRLRLPVFEVVYEDGVPVGLNPLCDAVDPWYNKRRTGVTRRTRPRL